MSWPFRRACRLIGLSWLVGFCIVGQAQQAIADDGLVVAPDLANGAAQTPFEQLPLSAYTLPINLSAANYGGPADIQAGVWGVMNGIETAIVYLSLTLVRGAIACLQWMLNLTIYRDNASQIDGAVQALAGHVFWPLLGSTLALAALMMYGRMKREGRGSIMGDLVWILAASVLAMTFVAAPSKVAGDLDDLRTLVADGAMTGYSSFAPAGQSAAGFPDVPVSSDATGANRALANSMWNTYAVSIWCLDAFNSRDVCKDVGHDYLTGDARWQKINAVNNLTGAASTDANVASTCAPELKDNCDWYRGQSFGRLGMVLIGFLISVPLALFLLALVLFGIMAVVGFLLLLLVGPIFLVAWMIPGKPRAIGVKWFEALIGSLLQSMLITVLVGAVMVLSAILSLASDKYGLFAVAMLNIAMFLMAFKIRAMFDNLTGMSSPTGNGVVSSYVAMKMLGAGARGAKGIVKGGAAVTTGTAKGTAAVVRRVDPVVNAIPQKMAQLGQRYSPTGFMPDSARSGPTMTARDQMSGPKALTTGRPATPWAPRPAGFKHSEPKVDPGAPVRTGKPGDVPAAADARTRIDPSLRPTVRPSLRGAQVPGAPPKQQTVHAPARQSQVVVYGSNNYAPTRGLKEVSTMPRTQRTPAGPEPRRPTGTTRADRPVSKWVAAARASEAEYRRRNP